MALASSHELANLATHSLNRRRGSFENLGQIGSMRQDVIATLTTTQAGRMRKQRRFLPFIRDAAF
jgi:hypothetical protein